MRDLEGLLGRLIRARVEFVVVGGYAAMAHGSSLLTMDVDICCRFTMTNLFRLQRAVADLHPVHRMTPARIPLALTRASCRGLKNLYLDTDYGQLDCLGSVLGLGAYAVVVRKSKKVRLASGPCRVLSLAALIRAKKAMGRPKDDAAVTELQALLGRERNGGRKRAANKR